MSEEDLELGENNSEEEGVRFPPEERKVTTTAYDLSVDTLVSQWKDEILVIPKMQREYVWDNGRASRLVESLLLNIPVPPVFFSETADSKYEVIDGHQRIRSVVRYINNEFALSGLRLMTEHLRLRFHQLPSREQRYLRTRVLRAIVIGPDSHPSMKHEIFQRLNTGAIALNAQEIRHALNQGSLNDLLHDLVTLKDFRKCVGSKSPRRRMVDHELVLRFFMLSEQYDSYRPPLLRSLNSYMEKNQKISADRRKGLRDSFARAATFNAVLFPEAAFRPADQSGKPTERGLNRALFDAQMVTAGWVDGGPPTAAQRQKILRKSSELFETEEFLDSIQRATGDRRRLITRMTMWGRTLEASGVAIDLPELSVK